MNIDHSKFLYDVERTYPVSLETLWNAWVDPAALGAWYSPTDLSVVSGSVENDATEGGVWAVAVDVSKFGMPNAYFYGRYTAVKHHEYLVHTMLYTQDEAEAAERDETKPHHMVVIDFAERDGGAWCRFSQFGDFPGGDIERTKAGMTSYFDNLGAYLAGK